MILSTLCPFGNNVGPFLETMHIKMPECPQCNLIVQSQYTDFSWKSQECYRLYDTTTIALPAIPVYTHKMDDKLQWNPKLTSTGQYSVNNRISRNGRHLSIAFKPAVTVHLVEHLRGDFFSYIFCVDVSRFSF